MSSRNAVTIHSDSTTCTAHSARASGLAGSVRAPSSKAPAPSSGNQMSSERIGKPICDEAISRFEFMAQTPIHTAAPTPTAIIA